MSLPDIDELKNFYTIRSFDIHLKDHFAHYFWNFILHIFPFINRYLDDPKREVKWGSNKLMEKGFVYKYDMKKILDDNIRSARELGDLKLPSA